MDLFVSCAVELSMGSLLLPEDDPILVRHRAACMSLDVVGLVTLPNPESRNKRTKRTQKNEHVPWPERHADYATRLGIADWNESSLPSAETQTLFPTLRRLRLREYDLMKLVSGVP